MLGPSSSPTRMMEVLHWVWKMSVIFQGHCRITDILNCLEPGILRANMNIKTFFLNIGIHIKKTRWSYIGVSRYWNSHYKEKASSNSLYFLLWKFLCMKTQSLYWNWPLQVELHQIHKMESFWLKDLSIVVQNQKFPGKKDINETSETLLFVSPSVKASLQRKLRWLQSWKFWQYRKTSSIIRTKSQNLNVSYLVLQLSLPNPLKPGVQLRMKM